MFRQKIGLEGACGLSGLLNRAQPYINYEEELFVEEGYRGQGARNIDTIRHNKEIAAMIIRRELRTSAQTRHLYPLEVLWKECAKIEFKEVGIRNLYSVKESFRIDRSKYYFFP